GGEGSGRDLVGARIGGVVVHGEDAVAVEVDVHRVSLAGRGPGDVEVVGLAREIVRRIVERERRGQGAGVTASGRIVRAVEDDGELRVFADGVERGFVDAGVPHRERLGRGAGLGLQCVAALEIHVRVAARAAHAELDVYGRRVVGVRVY